MTEEEAKTRWCPYGAGAKMIGEMGDNGKPVSVYARPDTAHCIGSQCMAWRWDVTPESAGDNPYEFVTAAVRWGGGLVQEMPKAQQEVPSGHCGLAGKP